mmetsp:Transcript_23699/g.80772  ORF Transcript_23699/g.80772 Transcript_23699/m.80772 type:complete len:119 (+) Transcript_23699:279-635(+)
MGLICNGKQLDPHVSLEANNVCPGSTLHVVLRLRGGKKTLCRIISQQTTQEDVEIEIGENDPKSVIKAAIHAVTGIPVQHMKLRLGGFQQIFVIDTRTAIKAGSCGISMAAELPPMQS